MQNLNRKRTRKIITVALSAVAAFIVIIIIVAMVTISLFLVKPLFDSVSTTSVTLHCTLNDSEYVYGITNDEQYLIIEAGGDSWIANHVQTEQYDDANILIAQIEDYFTERSGSCEIIEDAP